MQKMSDSVERPTFELPDLRRPNVDPDKGQAMKMLSTWARHGAHRRLQFRASPPAAAVYEVPRWILSESYAVRANDKRQRWNVVIPDAELCVDSAKFAIRKIQDHLTDEAHALRKSNRVAKK